MEMGSTFIGKRYYNCAHRNSLQQRKYLFLDKGRGYSNF